MNEQAKILDLQTDAGEVLFDLMEQMTEQVQLGEEVDVEAYVRKYPQYAEQLRKMSSTLEVLRDLAHSSTAGGANAREAPTTGGPQPAGTLGDYRILHEVGRGGMGVVYEAEQVSLARKVALKVLPFAAMLDQKQLQRFQNEARAAASLRHPNIVQVHFVGCERAVHFYAMDYIEGQTLAELIHHLRRFEGLEGEIPEDGGNAGSNLADTLSSGRFAPPKGSSDPEASTAAYTRDQTPGAAAETKRTPQAAISTERPTKNLAYFRSIAEIGVQVAEALDHAHEHGVIHRDVKPSNVILDNSGKPWVTDFGLARIETDATLTVSGDLLGTVRYMSPEQALAKRIVVDHRTDVYSLGATLYELLTLRPVFGGQDRNELLRQIAFEEPRAPRKLNKPIPKELEIIVLKAMAKNPAERYDTAQELADDLRRFLEDRPIRARRPTLVQRAAKWSRRHKPIVWSAAVSVFLLLVVGLLGLGIGNILITKERDAKDEALVAEREALEQKNGALLSAEANFQKAETERQRAEENLKLANEEQLRAEGNLDLALKALDAVYLVAIGEEKLLGEPLASPDQDGDAGSIPQRDLSKFEKELLDRGLTFYGEFANRNRQTSQAGAHTARAYYRVALLQGALEERDSAEAAYTEAINRFKALIRNEPENHRFHHELGQAYFGLAKIQPKWKDAERTYSKADESITAAIKMKPDTAEYYESRSEVRVGLGDYRHAQQDAEKATELAPDNIEYHMNAASKYTGSVHQFKDIPKAILHCEQALELDPANARAHSLFGAVLYYVDTARALEHFSRAIEIDPTDPGTFHTRARIYYYRLRDYERALSDANECIRLNQGTGGYRRRAAIYAAMGELDKAKADLEAAEQRTPPGSPEYAQLLDARAVVHFGLGDYTSAVNDLTRAIEQRPLTYWLVEHRGIVHFYMGQYGKALEDIKTSCELAPPGHALPLFVIPGHLVTACPDADFPGEYVLLAHKTMKDCKSLECWLMFAERLTTWGRHSDAKGALEKANELFMPDSTNHYDHYQRALVCLRLDDAATYRQSCRTMLNQLGDTNDPMVANFVAWTASLAADALDDYERALASAERAVNAQPDSDQFLNTLGAVLYRAGRHEDAIDRLAELDSRLGNPDQKAPTSPAYTWYFLAMAHKEAGNEGPAQEYLKKAAKRTDEVLDAKGHALVAIGRLSAWNRRATLELLRNEAEALLGADAAGSAESGPNTEGESNTKPEVGQP